MRKIYFNIISSICILLLIVGCEQKSEYKIGVIFPMSGGGAESGLSAFNGLKMCAEEWNERGGIMGKKITFQLEDSKADPKEGLTIARRLVSSSNKPNLMISAISGVTLNVQTVSEKNEIILMGIIGAENYLTDKTKFSIRNFITPKVTATAIINMAKTKFSNKKFNIAYCNTELGKSFSDAIKVSAETNNLSISKIFSFEEKENNYRNVIAKHNFGNEDVIYVVGVDRPLGLFVRQLRESGFNGAIIGDINIINSSCRDIIGTLMTNTYYINVKQNNDNLQENYKSIYNRDMDVLAIYSYNGLDLLLNYIKEHQSLNNKDIMMGLNGYKYDSKIGKISVVDNEINYEHILVSIN